MAFTEGSNDGALNGTTPVTLVAAPASSTRRLVRWINIHNRDTVANEIIVRYLHAAATRVICQITLDPKETLQLDEGDFPILDDTDKSITALMGGAVTTTNPDFVASYGDVT